MTVPARGTAGPRSAFVDPAASNPQADRETEQLYKRLAKGEFRDGPAGRIVMLVYSNDFLEARGDLYVAAGLARALVARGWGVRFVPRTKWRRQIGGADIVLSFLESFDPSVIPADIPAIAWVRNQTRSWIARDRLIGYDAVLSSSRLSDAELRPNFRGPTGILPIGVDAELFSAHRNEMTVADRTVVTTSVNHWGTERDLHRAVAASPEELPLVWFGDRTYLRPRLRRYCVGLVNYFALPDAYRRSILVLDDMNHTTLPFGNVNSRLFEALACGALVATNGSLGLPELGLDDVPVYRDPSDLRDIITAALAEPDAAAARAERLREIVLGRHTFEHRADDLVRFLPEARESAARKRTTIAFYPNYDAGNPYQRMLYAGARAAGARVMPAPFAEQMSRDTGGPLRGQVLHLHWSDRVLRGQPGPFSAYRRLDLFRTGIKDFKDRGGTLIWTVHNVLPHDKHQRTLELELHRFLAEQADVIHVLGTETLTATAPFYHLPPDKVRVIEHSSYVGAYPDWIGRTEARRRLRLLDQEIALLMLGQIRPYKGLDVLLPAFESALGADPRLHLLIAGRPGEDETLEPWIAECKAHPRVTASFEFVPDDELQLWFRAADLAVLPYNAILNSGSLHLAQTFGVPVIAPRTGVVGSALDPAFSVTFEPGDRRSLETAIGEAAQRLRSPEARRAARDAADLNSPAVMATKFLGLLRSVTPRDMWPESDPAG